MCKSMTQSLCWQADIFSTIQDTPILCETKTYYRVRNSLPFVPSPKQMNPLLAHMFDIS